MATTIDTLQIQIESSSSNAAQGIRELGEALGELKKNGSFTTAINNLNKLRDSLRLFNNIPSNASKVLSLSKSLEQLKSVGSVTSIGNSLSKLAESLKSLNTVNVDKGKMDSIANALSSLSAVKAGGINTMMNGLLKIGKVTESLNDKAIGDFAERVGVLVEKLTPLSEKMTTIQAGLKGINASARSAGGGVKEMANELDTASVNLSSFIYTIQEAVQWLQQAIQKFAEFMRAAVEWDGIHHQFGNAFGEQADEYYAKVVQITDALKINKQNFMEMSAMASSMLVGFGVTASDAREMGLGYTELAYDIWAAFNNVYKTLDGADGAMAAVRSAIAGEVEPIRRAGFTIVDSQLAITAANHGLAYSAATATEAQKSYLRYLTLVEQAQSKGIIGTYASEMDKAEGMMRTFSQQLKSLTQAFGSLFIPILVKVMPYLQAFVELLTEAVHAVAAFFGVEIQKVDFSGYSSGAGAIDEVASSAGGASEALGSATKAAKELKNATLGIDELNVINPAKDAAGSGGSGGGGGGGGGGGYDIPVSSIWDKDIFANVKDDVAAIKDKLEGWLPVIGAIAGGFAALRLAKLIIDIDDVVKKFKAILGITAASGAAGAAGGGILASIKEFFAAAKQMAPEVGWFAALFPKLSGWFASIGTAVSGAATAVGTFLAGISAPVWAAIVAAIAAVVAVVVFLKEHWDEVTAAVKRFFNENIAPKLEEIKGHFERMKEALSPLFVALDWLIQPIKDLIQGFKDWWAAAEPLKVLGDIFEVIGGVIFSAVSGVIAGAFQMLVGMIENAVQIITGVVEIVSGVVDLIVAVFTKGDIRAAWQKIWDGVVDVLNGTVGFIVQPVIDFVEGIIDWFIDLWDELVGHSIVPDTINAIVDWFTSLPDLVFGAVADFVTGIIDKFKNLGSGLTEKFSSAWESVKTWWGKKSNLSTYTPTIGNIASKISSAWESAKTWWKEKRGSLSTYTPSIGKIWEKLKSAWTSAKDWWNKNRSNLSYTPSIGSIKTKLSDAWTSAKNWWSKSRSSLSYTPSIGSIKDKVISAWNSAKNWWKNNVGGLSTKLNISVPKLTVQWAEVSALGKTFKYPKGFKLSFAADGGVFDQGSLVWAGERGPEVLANAAGGKTGVMNIQQMHDAVYEGVYAAMTAAMRANGGNDGGNRPVQVLMPDGRVLASTVEKAQRERGASLMGNQVYSYG